MAALLCRDSVKRASMSEDARMVGEMGEEEDERRRERSDVHMPRTCKR